MGSIEFIHRQIIAKRDAGTAVLLVSAELDEVMEMSDRIAVMYRGRIVAEMDGRTADKSEVGLLMATGRASDIADGVGEGGDGMSGPGRQRALLARARRTASSGLSTCSRSQSRSSRSSWPWSWAASG